MVVEAAEFLAVVMVVVAAAAAAVTLRSSSIISKSRGRGNSGSYNDRSTAAMRAVGAVESGAAK